MSERGTSVRRGASGDGSPDLAALLFLDHEGLPVAQRLVEVAAQTLPGADGVTLTTAGMSRGVQMVAQSDDIGTALAAMQSRLGEGPCLDPVGRNDVVHVPDLRESDHWPAFAQQAADLGIRSLLCVRTVVPPRGQVALTFYSGQTNAFTPDDVRSATILGSFAGLTVESDRQRERAGNLEIALESNRHIGTAIGILMAREKLTSDQAFQRLRDASQRQHRKLRDVAEDVARVGELPAG